VFYSGLLKVVLVSLGTHAYREWEFFASSAPSRFLANLPLFAANNVKLVGLILIIGIMQVRSLQREANKSHLPYKILAHWKKLRAIIIVLPPYPYYALEKTR
jgi:hypothetical protein